MNNTLLRIEKFAQHRPEAELVYALADSPGSRVGGWTDGASPRPWIVFSTPRLTPHDYLFETNPVLVEGRSPSDPRYRQAMEIYNGSVDHLIARP